MLNIWNQTTTNMLLENIGNIYTSLAPLINILLGIFFGIWLLEKIIDIVNMRKRHGDELNDEIATDRADDDWDNRKK